MGHLQLCQLRQRLGPGVLPRNVPQPIIHPSHAADRTLYLGLIEDRDVRGCAARQLEVHSLQDPNPASRRGGRHVVVAVVRRQIERMLHDMAMRAVAEDAPHLLAARDSSFNGGIFVGRHGRQRQVAPVAQHERYRRPEPVQAAGCVEHLLTKRAVHRLVQVHRNVIAKA